MQCRHCGHDLALTLVDLGVSPPSNSYLPTQDAAEHTFPLKVLVCDRCWLVQTEDFVNAEAMFAANYAYFSSFSSLWLAHARAYVAAVVPRFNLDRQSRVVEVAANDGYLLRYVRDAGIPCYGIEPTHATAEAARALGIEIIEAFFGIDLATRLLAQDQAADLMVANNVLAHVPDINDFVAGFTLLLKPHGVASFEFPHLCNLVRQCQFDTIYHEHFSYLSFTAVNGIFSKNGLAVFDVEELPTHGGSLRVFAQRADAGVRPVTAQVAALLAEESRAGMMTAGFYAGFQPRVEQMRADFLAFLADARAQGATVAAYGAAAKGNTLLNFCGVGSDQIQFVVDGNPAKQGRFLPGSRIPVVDEVHLRDARPDYVIILPWNLRVELTAHLAYIRDWGGRFVVTMPELTIL